MTMEQPPLRATDRDRDAAAAVVQEAHGDGRLDVEELDERLTRIYSSKTQLELRNATADLAVPVDTLQIRARGSSQKRVGNWRVPSHIVVTSSHSSVVLDFTKALVQAAEVLVEVEAQHSSTVLLVPRGWNVDVDGVQTEYSAVKSKVVGELTGGRRVRVTGRARHSSVLVRHPRRRRWYWPWGSR